MYQRKCNLHIFKNVSSVIFNIMNIHYQQNVINKIKI